MQDNIIFDSFSSMAAVCLARANLVPPHLLKVQPSVDFATVCVLIADNNATTSKDEDQHQVLAAIIMMAIIRPGSVDSRGGY